MFELLVKSFIIFSLKVLAQKLDYSLSSIIFPEGKKVILPGLTFLLDISTQDQTMKISFIIFCSKFYFLCI